MPQSHPTHHLQLIVRMLNRASLIRRPQQPLSCANDDQKTIPGMAPPPACLHHTPSAYETQKATRGRQSKNASPHSMRSKQTQPLMAQTAARIRPYIQRNLAMVHWFNVSLILAHQLHWKGLPPRVREDLAAIQFALNQTLLDGYHSDAQKK